MPHATGYRLRFGEYEFDSLNEKLLRNGHPVKLQPYPLRVLALLLRRRGEIVSRQEIRSVVWGDAVFVDFERGLSYSVRQIRLALQDGAAQQTYIETVPRQGYRFVAPVEELEAEPDSAPPAPAVVPLNEPVANAFLETAAAAAPRTRIYWLLAAAVCLVAIGLFALFSSRSHPSGPVFTQLTDFADASAPALSPDGHLRLLTRRHRRRCLHQSASQRRSETPHRRSPLEIRTRLFARWHTCRL